MAQITRAPPTHLGDPAGLRPTPRLRACRPRHPARVAAAPDPSSSSGGGGGGDSAAAAPAAGRRALLAAAAFAALAPAAAPAARAADAPARCFLDIRVDGEPFGRVVVETLPSAAPVGSARFLDLCRGTSDGVGYRRTKIEELQDGYVRATGPSAKGLSNRAGRPTQLVGGDSTEALEPELVAPAARRHDAPGLVSLQVRPAKERETKERLVAVKGSLVSVVDVLGDLPNGTSAVFTTRPEPGLDATHLVVGRIVEGLDVVERLTRLRRNKDQYGNPFFQAGKLNGDKRAVVAERGFNRPFSRISVWESGVL